MERANVAVVRRAYGAFERGDLPAVFAALHPAIELVQSIEVDWGGVYRGHDGARAFFQALAARADPLARGGPIASSTRATTSSPLGGRRAR